LTANCATETSAAPATHLSSNHLQRRQLISWLWPTTAAAAVISLKAHRYHKGAMMLQLQLELEQEQELNPWSPGSIR